MAKYLSGWREYWDFHVLFCIRTMRRWGIIHQYPSKKKKQKKKKQTKTVQSHNQRRREKQPGWMTTTNWNRCEWASEHAYKCSCVIYDCRECVFVFQSGHDSSVQESPGWWRGWSVQSAAAAENEGAVSWTFISLSVCLFVCLCVCARWLCCVLDFRRRWAGLHRGHSCVMDRRKRTRLVNCW